MLTLSGGSARIITKPLPKKCSIQVRGLRKRGQTDGGLGLKVVDRGKGEEEAGDLERSSR
jgi:hypothetical protein